MIEERRGWRRGRRALAVLQAERQRRRCSGRRQQRSEVQAVAANLMTVLRLLIRGRQGRSGSVGIGMRYRTQLSDEKRQRSKGYDAKFDAMIPIEQCQPLSRNVKMLTPSE